METQPLKFLLIEDSLADAELAVRNLRKEGFNIHWKRVDHEDGLKQALSGSIPTLIISDFSMPLFDGTSALRIAQEMAPDTPFIFLSGTIGEERAIEAIKLGATDYVLKDNPQRLGSAVRRALRDARESRRAQALMQEKVRLVEMLEATTDYVAMTDPDGKIVYLNTAWRRLIGLSTQDRTDKYIHDLFPQESLELVLEQAIPSAIQSGPWHGETKINDGTGQSIPVSQVFIAHQGENGSPQFLSTIARDIRERKAYEAQVSHLVNFDLVTDLPNRSLLSDRAEQAIMMAKTKGLSLALLVAGIDKFPRIVDSYGHHVGDILLNLVANRFAKIAREGDTVAHLGSGTFAILAPDGGQEELVSYVRKIRRTLRGSFEVENQDIACKVSIGISLFPHDAADFGTLLRNADAAMHRAAENGSEGFQFYAATMTHEALVRVQTERDLRRAMDRDELNVFYQPQVDLVSGRMTGVEALLRWHYKGQEWIPPARFLPVAEDSGMIFELGRLTLFETCRQLADMGRNTHQALRAAVNVSAKQFQDPHFLDDVRTALARSNLPPAQLEIEFTETVLVGNPETAIRILYELKSLGIQIAVDDFGTGYSSLSYLSRLPIDRLKIDGSFVRRLGTQGRDATIVQAVISLAHSLGLSVIAEGVETERQLTFLSHHACDEAQGFLFSRPVTPAILRSIASESFLK